MELAGNGSTKWGTDGLRTATEASLKLAALIPGATSNDTARWGAKFAREGGLLNIGSPHALIRLWKLFELFTKYG
jgi:hypothetical protein